MMKRWLIAAVLVTLLVSGLIYWQATLDHPLFKVGVVGQWTWRYDHSPYADRVVFSLVCAGLLGWLCMSARKHVRALVEWRLTLFLLTAMVLTFWLQVWFAFLSRSGFGEAVYWTSTPKINSYLAEAPKAATFRELLARSQDPNRPFRMHVSTHPPGPVVFYYVLLHAWELVPEQATAFDHFMETVLPHAKESRVVLEDTLFKEQIPATYLATIYSSIVILWLLVALAVPPLYFWSRAVFGPMTAIATVGLYALTPSLLLFNPMTDQVVVPVAVAMLASFHIGMKRRSPAMLSLAGILTWFGLQYSLSLLVILFLFAIYIGLESYADGLWLERLRLLGYSGAAFIAMIVVLLPFHYNALRVWQVSLTKAVGGETRQYLPWVVLNPVDFALFVGLPAAVFFVRGVGEAIQDRARGAASRLTVALVITLITLNFSGVNRGEVARLWMFLMPMAAAVAAHAMRETEPYGKHHNWVFPICFGLLFVQSVLLKLSFSVLLTGTE